MVEVTQAELERDVYGYCAEVAATLGRKHHNTSIMEPGDIRNELWLWASRRWEKIAGWLDPTQEPEDVKRGQNALRKSLYRQGDKFCRMRKALRAGYEPRDEAFYEESLLDALLFDAWDVEGDVGSQHDDGSRRAPSNPAEGGNRLTSLIDVNVGLLKLDKTDFDVLSVRYRDGMHPQDMAEDAGVSRTTMERRIRRALKALTNTLGGESPYGRG